MGQQTVRDAMDVGAAGAGGAGRLSARLAELLGLLRADTAVLLRRTESVDFEVVATAGAPPLPHAGELLPGGLDSVCGFAAAQQGAVIFEDVTATARFKGATMATKFGAVSSIVVALRNRGEVTGVLSVHSRTVRSFSGAEALEIEQAAEGLVLSLEEFHASSARGDRALAAGTPRLPAEVKA